MDDAKILLSPLDADLPLSRMDPADLVRRGQRAVRKRRMMMAGATVATLMAAGAPMLLARGEADSDPAEQPVCRIERLPLPSGESTGTVTDGDSTGRYLVGVADQQVLLWDNGKLSVLEPPTSMRTENVVVNAVGEVAGSGLDRYATQRTWTYRNGKFEILPAGDPIDVVDINDSGIVLGQGDVPVRWDPAGSLVGLKLPPNQLNARAVSIDSAGNVTVGGRSKEDQPSSWLWLANDGMEMIPQPVDAMRSAGSWLVGMDASGQTVKWQHGDPSLEQLNQGTFAVVIGGQGRFAGLIGSGTASPTPVAALGDGHLTLLPTLGHTAKPDYISDDGTVIAGMAATADKTEVPVMWRCG